MKPFRPGTLNREQAEALNDLLAEVEDLRQQAAGGGGADQTSGPGGTALSVPLENSPKPITVRLKERPEGLIPPTYHLWKEAVIDDGAVPFVPADGMVGDSNLPAISMTGTEAPRNMESYPLAMVTAQGNAVAFWSYPIMRFIQILSLEQSPEGFYPAREMTFDPVTLVWIPGEECWWRDANQ
jgi:hypothetical protein